MVSARRGRTRRMSGPGAAQPVRSGVLLHALMAGGTARRWAAGHLLGVWGQAAADGLPSMASQPYAEGKTSSVIDQCTRNSAPDAKNNLLIPLMVWMW